MYQQNYDIKKLQNLLLALLSSPHSEDNDSFPDKHTFDYQQQRFKCVFSRATLLSMLTIIIDHLNNFTRYPTHDNPVKFYQMGPIGLRRKVIKRISYMHIILYEPFTLKPSQLLLQGLLFNSPCRCVDNLFMMLKHFYAQRITRQ